MCIILVLQQSLLKYTQFQSSFHPLQGAVMSRQFFCAVVVAASFLGPTSVHAQSAKLPVASPQATIPDAETIEITRKRANEGNPIAQFNMGVYAEKGWSMPVDMVAARSWYLLACEQGHIKAQFNLALMYLLGEGGPEEPLNAVKYFTLAADQGDAPAHV